jgi:hypothetical protein
MTRVFNPFKRIEKIAATRAASDIVRLISEARGSYSWGFSGDHLLYK